MTIKAGFFAVPFFSTAMLITNGLFCPPSDFLVLLPKNIFQEFRLTPEELKAFEGYYQFENNSKAYLQISAKGNGLITKQLWDEKEFFIIPTSPLEFYCQNEEFPAKFTKGSDGKVMSVLVFNRDDWKKVPDSSYTPPKFITLTPEKLKTFEGKFTFQFEPGNDAYIQITAYEDYLVLTESWSGNKIRFSPVSELEFYSKERAFPLRFTRDKNGTVTSVLAFNRDLWTKVR